MTKTLSETYFEKLCAELYISLKRIPEAYSKTPDYELTINGQTIITEVKEIIRNKEEQESDRVLQERGYGNVLSSTPGDRVRKKISEALPQIKARSKGIYPGLLILFDRGFAMGHLDPYCIRVAMYGLEQIHFAVPNDPSISPYATGMSFGLKRKMTKEHNTSISAIGVLFATGTDELSLHVYHNRYAAVPIQTELLTKYRLRQFRLGEEVPGRTAQWQEIEQPKVTIHQHHFPI
jgi:hypothetical protein